MDKLAPLILLLFMLVSSCDQTDDAELVPSTGTGNAPRRIVSLDYCADQYVLKLIDANNIAALSPDATASFSYMRDAADNFDTIRPYTETILLYHPDIVVRTYGGGANIQRFLERTDIDLVQIGYASDLTDVKATIRKTAQLLDVEARGKSVVADMQARLAALPRPAKPMSVLYLTSKGAVAGRNTMIDDLIETAGLTNFQESTGWSSIPLEQLVYQRPDIIATGFFETSDLSSDIWTPTRHPVLQRALQDTSVVNLPGAWTSCGAWFLMDAAEALAQHAVTLQNQGEQNG